MLYFTSIINDCIAAKFDTLKATLLSYYVAIFVTIATIKSQKSPVEILSHLNFAQVKF